MERQTVSQTFRKISIHYIKRYSLDRLHHEQVGIRQQNTFGLYNQSHHTGPRHNSWKCKVHWHRLRRSNLRQGCTEDRKGYKYKEVRDDDVYRNWSHIERGMDILPRWLTSHYETPAGVERVWRAFRYTSYILLLFYVLTTTKGKKLTFCCVYRERQCSMRHVRIDCTGSRRCGACQ